MKRMTNKNPDNPQKERDPFWNTVASFGVDKVFVDSDWLEEQRVEENIEPLPKQHAEEQSEPSIGQINAEKETPVETITDIPLEMTSLISRIGECESCRLGRTRNKLVFGEGNPEAGIVIVGEAPGATEDEQGKPFVGRSGQLLDKILASIDLDRTKVFITNIVKCRPPGNKDPQKDEVASCWWILEEQIRIMQPGIIITLGVPASKTLIGTTEGIGKLRGKELKFNGIPVLCTYHPAALLR
ncbi:MAG: uracil-DNA glycosylase, partial [FCB group bacterium]|nr:uracil-DNA glycosylase [FCB group bacterium]